MAKASRKNVVAIKKTYDHWDILEHIEAPMWVDLTLEAKSGYVDTDGDDWFDICHPFHQLFARQLKFKFSHTREDILTSEVYLNGFASPKLPGSVSKSRGKNYYDNKREGIDLNNLLEKQKGLGRRGFQQGNNFGQEVKPKSKLNFNRPKGSLSAKMGLDFDCNSRGKAESMASCSNPESSSSSVNSKTIRRTTRSTISSESTRQQQKCSVWKSQVTGQVSKVGIGCGLQSRGSKSSSGKSSVGSSSNPGYEVKFVSRQQRGKITDEKCEVTINLSVKNQCKPGGEISNISTISFGEAKSGNRKGSNINFAKPANRRTAKSLVQYQSTCSKALLQHKVNKENTCTDVAKEKLGTRKVNNFTAKGKENAARNVTIN